MKRVLISVFDKEGIEDMARFLKDKGYEIVSTGGTHRFLSEKGLAPMDISDVTGFPEMLDGRVKTLHPKIHGGLLALRNNAEHMAKIKEHDITPIDMVIVNLYPFFKEVQSDKTFEEKVEFIDIGGPTMLRSAAKNYQDVAVITDPKDYSSIQNEMDKAELSLETKKRLAGKVFNLTSAYDGAISQFFLGDDALPEYLQTSYRKRLDLRYGENPHQRAAFYEDTRKSGALSDFKQLNGKELSFNNIRDMDRAWKIVNEFDELVCCSLKHSIPCGVATGTSALDAYNRAYQCDPVSIFGGIVAINGEVDGDTAREMVKIFLEIVIASSFTDEALEVLKGKKNLRVILTDKKPSDAMELVNVDGGMLVQNCDSQFSKDFKVVTKVKPSDEDMKDLIFGQRVVKHVKSNAIVVVNNGMAKGISGGETNRIWPAEQALARAEKATVLCSDAFFPFDDVVRTASEAGIRAIIQPGGSMKDEDSVKAADELGIAMIFTGMRHFNH